MSQVSLHLAAVALGLTPLLLLDYCALHEHRSHSLRLGRLRRRRHPPIVKIRCTPHYMGLTQARPNYIKISTSEMQALWGEPEQEY